MINIIWTIIFVMFILWIFGFILHIGGILIHLLLVLALIGIVYNILTVRKIL